MGVRFHTYARRAFFKNEYGKLQYGPGEIKLFRDEWEKLGYKNPKLVLKRLDKEYVCQVINTILRRYAEYRSEHEYAGLSEQDKIIFDWHYAFFNKEVQNNEVKRTPEMRFLRIREDHGG